MPDKQFYLFSGQMPQIVFPIASEFRTQFQLLDGNLAGFYTHRRLLLSNIASMAVAGITGSCFGNVISRMQITVNGESHEIKDESTIKDLLTQLNLSSRYVAVERNLILVPRAEHENCRLEPGDQLEIVTLVGGG